MAVQLEPAAMALFFVFLVGTVLLVALVAWSIATPPADPGQQLTAPGSDRGLRSKSRPEA